MKLFKPETLRLLHTGWNTVEREGISISHPARFILVGSGNPEEGELRPQLLDRQVLWQQQVSDSLNLDPKKKRKDYSDSVCLGLGSPDISQSMPHWVSWTVGPHYQGGARPLEPGPQFSICTLAEPVQSSFH